MTVYRSLKELPYKSGSVLTIGTFDGVHPGHKKVVEALTGKARELGGLSIILTFHPHPQVVLRKKGDAMPILTTIGERAAELEKLGLDALVVMEFTLDFASTPWQLFCERLMKELGVEHIVMGYDHAFGKNREGTAERIREWGAEHGFGVTEIGPLEIGSDAISSTKIRKALLAGEIDKATEYLGHPYQITGMVIKGDGRGRALGIPTANIRPLDPEKLVPANGVYCVVMLLSGKEHRGMANIGVRPTFTEGTERTIEVNLFDFDADIYGQGVTLEFRKFVRSEQKFASKEEFLEQLERDREVCGAPA